MLHELDNLLYANLICFMQRTYEMHAQNDRKEYYYSPADLSPLGFKTIRVSLQNEYEELTQHETGFLNYFLDVFRFSFEGSSLDNDKQ